MQCVTNDDEIEDVTSRKRCKFGRSHAASCCLAASAASTVQHGCPVVVMLVLLQSSCGGGGGAVVVGGEYAVGAVGAESLLAGILCGCGWARIRMGSALCGRCFCLYVAPTTSLVHPRNIFLEVQRKLYKL